MNEVVEVDSGRIRGRFQRAVLQKEGVAEGPCRPSFQRRLLVALTVVPELGKITQPVTPQPRAGRVVP